MCEMEREKGRERTRFQRSTRVKGKNMMKWNKHEEQMERKRVTSWVNG